MTEPAELLSLCWTRSTENFTEGAPREKGHTNKQWNKMMYNSKITGMGFYVPENVVTNDELTKMMDTSDEWIQERTGSRREDGSKKEAMKRLPPWARKLPK